LGGGAKAAHVPNLPRWHKHQFAAGACAGAMRRGPSVRADLDEEIARADVVQLEDRVKIACENNIAR
jgi:hypothetical protein